MNKFHKSVLLEDSVDGLNIKPDGTYVDATFGGGGHSRLILNKISDGKLIAFDQDQEAVKNQINNDNRFVMINNNFRFLKQELQSMGILNIDGLIADLGVSAYHFSDNNRGFSLKYNSTIDMRMDMRLVKDGVFVLNNYSRESLIRIFRNHADFRNPQSIVDSIIDYRLKKVIQTTFDFKEIFLKHVPFNKTHKFFARLFQAIRIEVNDEITALKELLHQTLELLNSSGRLVVISYHSIEDRIVKNFMRFGTFANSAKKDFFGNPFTPFNLINRKPIIPSELEVKLNHKSRSARLRVCEKI